MSTPVGAHRPIPPDAFARRVDAWSKRVKGADFVLSDYRETMEQARAGDVVYCDPPYSHSQAILYGAQDFKLSELFEAIERCKRRGASVVLSIDGTKQSGRIDCELEIPEGLFRREAFVEVGRSMLKRFQMEGLSLGAHVVHDRLLLTF